MRDVTLYLKDILAAMDSIETFVAEMELQGLLDELTKEKP